MDKRWRRTAFFQASSAIDRGYFLNEYSFEASALFNPASCDPDSRTLRRAACALFSAFARSAKPYFFTDVSRRHDRS